MSLQIFGPHGSNILCISFTAMSKNTLFSFNQDENNTENAVSSSDAEKQDSPPPKPPRTRRYLTVFLYYVRLKDE